MTPPTPSGELDRGEVAAPIVCVVGARAALGPLRRDLAPLYHRWRNDFVAQRTFEYVPRPWTLEELEAWYERRVAGRDEVAFTVYERATWRTIGHTALFEIDERNRTATFGILIGEPDARGRGYGTEATRLTLEHAFTVVGMENEMLTVSEYNLAERRAYERAGFREFGRRRCCDLLGGELWDTIVMEVLAGEYESPARRWEFVPDPLAGERPAPGQA